MNMNEYMKNRVLVKDRSWNFFKPQ